MQFEDLKKLIQEAFPTAVLDEDLASNPKALIIDVSQVKQVCQFLHDHEATYFDSLSCLTGIDLGVESAKMEVVYHLYSIPFDLKLAIRVVLDRSAPKVDSVSSIWKTADWHEREAFDLVGIYFNDHPDLRRILLPADWEGYPLRKDYEPQEKYHDVKVKY